MAVNASVLCFFSAETLLAMRFLSALHVALKLAGYSNISSSLSQRSMHLTEVGACRHENADIVNLDAAHRPPVGLNPMNKTFFHRHPQPQHPRPATNRPTSNRRALL